MREKNAAPIGVGLITVFMILIVLALATFSVLTFTSARADARLSRINADTVTAYYAADAEAAALYAAFAAQDTPSLDVMIPMTESQNLHLSLARDEAGAPVILAWQAVAADSIGEWVEPVLPVWEG